MQMDEGHVDDEKQGRQKLKKKEKCCVETNVRRRVSTVQFINIIYKNKWAC